LFSGVPYQTIFEKDGKYHQGENVRVINIDDGSFMRIDSNSMKADILGNLPNIN
jgi:hypothetical protein